MQNLTNLKKADRIEGKRRCHKMDMDYNIDEFGDEINPEMPVTIDELPELDPDIDGRAIII